MLAIRYKKVIISEFVSKESSGFEKDIFVKNIASFFFIRIYQFIILFFLFKAFFI